jgi:hypothetical protein
MRWSSTKNKAQIERFWNVSYTCGCGLYVHPDNRLTSPSAIHIDDCMWTNHQQDRRAQEERDWIEEEMNDSKGG